MKMSKHIRELDRLFEDGDGVITTSAAVRSGVPKRVFYRYVSDKGLSRRSQGVYQSDDATPDELALFQLRFRKAVYSHDTALFLHEMTEREPSRLSVSVESGYNSASLRGQAVHVHYVLPEWHGMGVCEVKTPDGNLVRAYDRERTVCDVIRARAKMDVSEFNFALKAYASCKGKDLARLSGYARAMGMESRVWDVMGVLL